MLKQNRAIFIAISLITLLGFTATARTAFAQHQSTPKVEHRAALAEEDVKQLLLLMDTDKNGNISRGEYMTFMQAEFDRLDMDKSGELDAKELAKSNMRPSSSTGENYVKQLLLLMDTDKNGKVSRKEYTNFIQAEFNRLDHDKNGDLDVKELTESRLRPTTFTSVGK